MNMKDLLIERPLSQSRTQRWTSNSLTTIAWCMMFYGFLPILGVFVGSEHIPKMILQNEVTSMGAWGSLIPLIPRWAAIAAIFVVILYLWATIQFIRFRGTRRTGQTAAVTTSEMAAHCHHPEENVRSWGKAKRAVVHFDNAAQMTGVSLEHSTPFREVPKEGEKSAPTVALATPRPLQKCADGRRVALENDLYGARRQLVQLWAQVEALEALMRDVEENRERRKNNRDIALYEGMKTQHEQFLARILHLRSKLGETRYLLEEHKASLTEVFVPVDVNKAATVTA